MILNKFMIYVMYMSLIFRPTLYNGCNYLRMLGLKLIHLSKGPLEAIADAIILVSRYPFEVSAFFEVWVSRDKNLWIMIFK